MSLNHLVRLIPVGLLQRLWHLTPVRQKGSGWHSNLGLQLCLSAQKDYNIFQYSAILVLRVLNINTCICAPPWRSWNAQLVRAYEQDVLYSNIQLQLLAAQMGNIQQYSVFHLVATQTRWGCVLGFWSLSMKYCHLVELYGYYSNNDPIYLRSWIPMAFLIYASYVYYTVWHMY